MSKQRQTRTEYLESLLRSLMRANYGDLYIEFKPFTGWVLSGEPRHIGDQGDVIGSNWREAEQYLRWVFA